MPAASRRAAAARCAPSGRAPTPTVLAYMDVDLSTDLAALLPLVAPLISGHSDLAIGTRLARGSRVVRGAKREVISRGYNLMLRGTLAARFSRRAVRLQGDPARRRRAAAAAGRGHRLVLRHRAAGAGRAQRAAHPRGAGGLGRRPGQPGRHRRRPRSPTSRGIARVGRALATGRLPLAELRAQLGPAPLPTAADRACRRAWPASWSRFARRSAC